MSVSPARPLLRRGRSALVASLLAAPLAMGAVPASAAVLTAPTGLTITDDYVTHSLAASSTSSTAVPCAPDADTTLDADEVAEGCPENGFGVREPVLSWKGVSGATSYDVEIGPDADFAQTAVLTKTGIKDNQYVVPQKLPHNNYFWRVRARSASGSSAWALGSQFARTWAVSPTILKVNDPSGGTNPDGTTSDKSLSISWTPVSGATFYQVQIATADYVHDDANGSVQWHATWDPDVETSRTINCYTNHTAFSPYAVQTLLASDQAARLAGDCMNSSADDPAILLTDDTQYFVRVRPWDSDTEAALGVDSARCAGHENGGGGGLKTTSKPVPGVGAECGFWSDSESFTFVGPDSSTPSTVSLLAPRGCASGASVTSASCPDMPTLRWTRQPGAIFYLVTVSQDPDHDADQTSYTEPIRSWATQVSSLTPPESLEDHQANGGYYYTVQACSTPEADDTGCTALQSAPGRFSVRHATTRLMTPRGAKADSSSATGLTVRANEVTLEWFHQHGAASYDVQIASYEDVSFADPLRSTTAVDTPQVTYLDLPDGDYRWRVRINDGSGMARRWSEGKAFSINGTLAVFSIPTTLPLTGAIRVRSSEEVKASTVTGSTVYLVRAGTTTKVPATLATTSDSQTWTLTPSSPLIAGLGYELVVGSTVKDAYGTTALSDGTVHSTPTTVDSSSKALRVTAGTWTTKAATNAIGGSYRTSATKGAGLTTKVHGKQAVVYGCKGPSSGKVDISVSGVTKRVDTYSSFTQCGVALYASQAGSVLDRTVTITVVGAHSSSSKGNAVAVDAVKVL